MKTYARIQDGVVAETIEIAEERDIYEFFPASMTWVEITALRPQPSQQWTCSGGVFAPPAAAAPSIAQLSAAVRADRDSRLAACDWTQLRDVPDATSSLWAAYRQALRNVTSQSGFPASVSWPTPPAA